MIIKSITYNTYIMLFIIKYIKHRLVVVPNPIDSRRSNFKYLMLSNLKYQLFTGHVNNAAGSFSYSTIVFYVAWITGWKYTQCLMSKLSQGSKVNCVEREVRYEGQFARIAGNFKLNTFEWRHVADD